MNGYRLLLVSVVGERDGMALELSHDSGEQLAEVFEDGESHARTFTVFTDQPVPLAAVEWLLAEASRRL
ncbi:MAG: hypothetical protein ACRCYU_01625 [Nocardioides sp.]